jgi:Zn-dependent peptidase ImmA (M78 family)
MGEWEWFGGTCWVHCDKDERRKTREALNTLFKKVPRETIDRLGSLLIYAPSGIYGCAWEAEEGQKFVFLPECLESAPQADVEHTVAHELAHLALGHSKNGHAQMFEMMPVHDEKPNEWEANKLAASWGFPDPYKKPKYRFWGDPEGSLWD